MSLIFNTKTLKSATFVFCIDLFSSGVTTAKVLLQIFLTKSPNAGGRILSCFMERNDEEMLEKGIKAPDFTLADKDGNMVRLSSFLGKKVVLYFYSKDNTAGCTRQACAFRDNYEGFRQKGVVVIGISKDEAVSHQKFAEKHGLPFLLLSDTEKTVLQAYDVWQEKKMYGKTVMGVVRTTYVIDETGIIEKVFHKVKPDTNAEEILSYLNNPAV